MSLVELKGTARPANGGVRARPGNPKAQTIGAARVCAQEHWEYPPDYACRRRWTAEAQRVLWVKGPASCARRPPYIRGGLDSIPASRDVSNPATRLTACVRAPFKGLARITGMRVTGRLGSRVGQALRDASLYSMLPAGTRAKVLSVTHRQIHQHQEHERGEQDAQAVGACH